MAPVQPCSYPMARPGMPLGCLSQFSNQHWESVIDVDRPELFNAETLNAGFAKCITMVEEQLAEIMASSMEIDTASIFSTRNLPSNCCSNTYSGGASSGSLGGQFISS